MGLTTAELSEEIIQVVALIPSGRVATYGQVARAAGLAKHARFVGYVLRQLPKESKLPWHRVVNAQGKIQTLQNDESGQFNLQVLRLQQEGLLVQAGRVSLAAYQWQP